MPCRDSAVLHLLCLPGQATVTPWDRACGMEKVSPQQHFQASSYTEIMRVAFPIGSARPGSLQCPMAGLALCWLLTSAFPGAHSRLLRTLSFASVSWGSCHSEPRQQNKRAGISEIMNGLRDGEVLEPAKHSRQQTKCHATHGDAWHALQARDKECQWGVCWQASAL